jgi:hypothetical protein
MQATLHLNTLSVVFVVIVVIIIIIIIIIVIVIIVSISLTHTLAFFHQEKEIFVTVMVQFF